VLPMVKVKSITASEVDEFTLSDSIALQPVIYNSVTRTNVTLPMMMSVSNDAKRTNEVRAKTTLMSIT
jgi:hypothetical protein